MLYLASSSPRRSGILKMAGYDFTVEPAHISETVLYIMMLNLESPLWYTGHADCGTAFYA